MKMEKGDIVYLKSGSPPLTVEDFHAFLPIATVCWFNAGHAEHADFPVACLTHDARKDNSQLDSDLSAIPTSLNRPS